MPNISNAKGCEAFGFKAFIKSKLKLDWAYISWLNMVQPVHGIKVQISEIFIQLVEPIPSYNHTRMNLFWENYKSLWCNLCPFNP